MMTFVFFHLLQYSSYQHYLKMLVEIESEIDEHNNKLTSCCSKVNKATEQVYLDTLHCVYAFRVLVRWYDIIVGMCTHTLHITLHLRSYFST